MEAQVCKHSRQQKYIVIYYYINNVSGISMFIAIFSRSRDQASQDALNSLPRGGQWVIRISTLSGTAIQCRRMSWGVKLEFMKQKSPN